LKPLIFIFQPIILYTINLISPIGENILISEKGLSVEKVKKFVQMILDEYFEIKWQKQNQLKNEYIKWQPDIIATIKTDKKEYKLLFEIKNIGEPRKIAQTASFYRIMTDKKYGYPVFIAPYISERGRKICKELNIGCIDFSGNVYLKFDGILIDIRGRDNIQKEKRLHKKLFTKKATWIFRKMLQSPERTWKIEELVKEANVSLGQTYKVTEKLVKENYIEKNRGAIKLLKPGELLDEWVKNYNFTEQSTISYYCPIKSQVKIYSELKKIPGDLYALTLGSGAQFIAPFVRSSDIYLYTRGKSDKIIQKMQLKPVEFGGNVSLIIPTDRGVFFDTQQIEGLTIVSNIQLFLDLYNYPKRGREQAEFLREKVMEV